MCGVVAGIAGVVDSAICCGDERIGLKSILLLEWSVRRLLSPLYHILKAVVVVVMNGDNVEGEKEGAQERLTGRGRTRGRRGLGGVMQAWRGAQNIERCSRLGFRFVPSCWANEDSGVFP